MLEVRNCRIRISRSRTHRTGWFRDFRTRIYNVYNAGKKEIKEVLDNNLVKPLDEKFPA